MQISSQDLPINKVFSSLFFGGSAYYVFNRQNRHRKIYNSKF
jgi:hypothetical protein